MNIDGQHLYGHGVEPVDPGRHGAVLGLAHLGYDLGPLAAVEPDLVVESGGPQALIALAVIAMAGGAIVGKDLLAEALDALVNSQSHISSFDFL